MAHEHRYGKIEDDFVERRKNKAKLVSALQVLFGLLEEHGPILYTERCQNLALLLWIAALVNTYTCSGPPAHGGVFNHISGVPFLSSGGQRWQHKTVPS